MIVTGAAHRSSELIHDPANGLMKPTEPHWSEVHIPQSVINFFEANLELGEQVTDVHPARVPADPAVATD